MKQIVLVRHGKSSWEYSVNDKDRPLLPRGIADGHLVVEAFDRTGILPDVIFSSPAIRAMHTCLIFLRKLEYPLGQFGISNELYDFSGDEVMRFIKKMDNSLNTVMLFGHNHAFTHLANSLGSQYIDNVPTSGLVHMTFEIDNWNDVGSGITSNIIFPKHLK
ncbi:histidine phosphatase family protein [Maribacter sp. ANRC-HE7]|uniref:Histidine phosphatase family protein n=1 Tax=Maribacter aquimaris TaxID=2737171 RepID=A0ABR7V226_9FLAO|nr:histidine phosphatase family protein [Maribacter aquimaris]MBD0778872.1 histidine phosphatase family protein [Maribacter aquimaris]